MRRSLALLAGLALALLAAHPATAQTMSFDLGEGGSSTGRIVQLMVLVTVLSLAPAILITVTSFTRIIIVLSFLRNALGIQQTPPNTVLVSLAL
ncbi:MAG TPA: flagellar biosynthetic protein FliP, partial [Stellaceae bacterium]|nr:flagellar biosynthetic protein FliP [Stellaceae bacterium]